MADWRKREPRIPWREFLTDGERAVIEAGDAAMERARTLNRDRPKIVNRAIQRAKYHARDPHPGADGGRGK